MSEQHLELPGQKSMPLTIKSAPKSSAPSAQVKSGGIREAEDKQDKELDEPTLWAEDFDEIEIPELESHHELESIINQALVDLNFAEEQDVIIKALKSLAKVARDKNYLYARQAMFYLGEVFARGAVVDTNYSKALHWFNLLAKHNDGIGFYAIGKMHELGHGVMVDHSKALRLYLAAADRNEPLAKFAIGRLYEMGHGVVQSYEEAHHWYTMALRDNCHHAMYALGRMYFLGKGVAQNYKQARTLYERAATLDNYHAMRELADIYRQGLGVDPDEATAQTWAERADDTEQAYTFTYDYA